MRTTLIALLVVSLLVFPVALAAAEPGARGREQAQANRPAPTHDDAPEEPGANAEARHENARGKPVAFLAALHAARVSWHENATAVRESCHAQEKPDENWTSEERQDRAHCIRDGYKSFFESFREQLRELRGRGAHA